MAFSWFFKPKKDSKTLGVNLGNGEGIKAEIDKMQGSIVKASKGYQTNIKKYKEIAQFNQHLTRSYVANLKVIVDVSELLNSYTSVFNSLKDEFAKMEEAMGRQMDKSDFDYLESLTKAKMDDLNSEFNKQADGIKKLYAQYGKPEELNRILVAQNDMQKALEQANTTYTTVIAEDTSKKTNASTSNNSGSSTNANANASKNATSNARSNTNVNSTKETPQSIVESIAVSEQALVNASLKKAKVVVETSNSNSNAKLVGGKKRQSKKSKQSKPSKQEQKSKK
jgi:hypothetical protein